MLKGFKKFFARLLGLSPKPIRIGDAQLIEKMKPRSPRGLRFSPRKGFAFNPVLNWPRNAPCVCGSGKKFKLCHFNRLPKTVRIEDVPGLAKLVRTVQKADHSIIQKALMKVRSPAPPTKA